MLTLASRSPQRRAILEQLGVRFEVVPADIEEITSGDPPAVVVQNALRKARAVPGERVLGVDTEVVLDGRVYGKPADEQHENQSACPIGKLEDRRDVVEKLQQDPRHDCVGRSPAVEVSPF